MKKRTLSHARLFILNIKNQLFRLVPLAHQFLLRKYYLAYRRNLHSLTLGTRRAGVLELTRLISEPRFVIKDVSIASEGMALKLTELRQGEFIEPSEMSLGEHLNRWLDFKKPSLGERTFADYYEVPKRYIVHPIKTVRSSDMIKTRSFTDLKNSARSHLNISTFI
jgi:hypothetical protein